MDFVVSSNINIEVLQVELEAKMQRDVLPLLAGCTIEGPISLENNVFLIQNAVVKLIDIGDPTTCSSNSQGLCSSVYLELDVFSKDDNDELDQSVLIQISDVFQDAGLLELLQLTSPVEDIDSVTVFDLQAVASPSLSPSKQDDSLSSPETCDTISNGTPVSGQENMGFQQYDIAMDVMLDSETEELSPLTVELEDKIQRLLLPSLAGCTSRRRRLQIESFIANALVVAEVIIGTACLPESERPCVRYGFHVDIYLQRIVSSFDFSEEIVAKFRESPLVERLGLLSPFKNITVVDIISATVSANPSAQTSTLQPASSNPSGLNPEPTKVPSVAPSNAPSPTPPPTLPGATPLPTQTASASPSQLASKAPTATPSAAPVIGATPSPSAAPVIGATPSPTTTPSVSPSANPTPAPSTSPSAQPSLLPSRSPSTQPSSSPSAQPSPQPSASPSAQPSPSPSAQPSPQPSTSPSTSPSFPCFQSNNDLSNSVGSWLQNPTGRASVEGQYGLIGDWCFSASVTSMGNLFRSAAFFDEDISNWDVSGITDMEWMFKYARAFNQDITSWDVSAVTRMNSMFSGASAFNQDISSWDVSAVRFMAYMFQSASAFNQDLCPWNSRWPLYGGPDFENIFEGANSCESQASGSRNSLCYGCTNVPS